MTKCILIFLLIIFISCNRSHNSSIIKQQEMQQVLWDIIRADALAQQIATRDSTKKLSAETVRLTKEVFKIHNITEDQFKKSYAYYSGHPDVLKVMFDSLNVQQIRKNNLEMQQRTRPVIDTNIRKQ